MWSVEIVGRLVVSACSRGRKMSVGLLPMRHPGGEAMNPPTFLHRWSRDYQGKPERASMGTLGV